MTHTYLSKIQSQFSSLGLKMTVRFRSGSLTPSRLVSAQFTCPTINVNGIHYSMTWAWLNQTHALCRYNIVVPLLSLADHTISGHIKGIPHWTQIWSDSQNKFNNWPVNYFKNVGTMLILLMCMLIEYNCSILCEQTWLSSIEE